MGAPLNPPLAVRRENEEVEGGSREPSHAALDKIGDVDGAELNLSGSGMAMSYSITHGDLDERPKDMGGRKRKLKGLADPLPPLANSSDRPNQTPSGTDAVHTDSSYRNDRKRGHGERTSLGTSRTTNSIRTRPLSGSPSSSHSAQIAKCRSRRKAKERRKSKSRSDEHASSSAASDSSIHPLLPQGVRYAKYRRPRRDAIQLLRPRPGAKVVINTTP